MQSDLIQLKTIDQTHQKTDSRLAIAPSSLIALHNSLAVMEFGATGNTELLKKLTDEKSIQEFIAKAHTYKKDLGALNADELKNIVANLTPASLKKKG